MSVENVVVWLRQPYETEVIRELNQHGAKFNVIRRCADAADARSTIQAGLSRILIADADAIGMDATFIDDMKKNNVFILLLVEDALTTPHIGESARCEYSSPADLIQTLILGVKQYLFGITAEVEEPIAVAQTPAFNGKTIVVWGTHGAPGRSTIAYNLACQWGQKEVATTLIDADLQAPTLIQLAGDEPGNPGIAAAMGLRNRGSLNSSSLAEITLPIGEHTALLSGLNRADRWRQIGAEGLKDLLTIVTQQSHAVLDLGAGLGEADPSQLTFVPSREDINLSILQSADALVIVAKADTIGLTRLSNLLDDCAENELTVDLIIINFATPKDRKLKHALNRILARIAPEKPFIIIEENPDVPQALLAAQPVSQLNARSPFRKSIDTVISYLNAKLADDMGQ